MKPVQTIVIDIVGAPDGGELAVEIKGRRLRPVRWIDLTAKTLRDTLMHHDAFIDAGLHVRDGRGDFDARRFTITHTGDPVELSVVNQLTGKQGVTVVVTRGGDA